MFDPKADLERWCCQAANEDCQQHGVACHKRFSSLAWKKGAVRIAIAFRIEEQNDTYIRR